MQSSTTHPTSLPQPSLISISHEGSSGLPNEGGNRKKAPAAVLSVLKPHETNSPTMRRRSVGVFVKENDTQSCATRIAQVFAQVFGPIRRVFLAVWTFFAAKIHLQNPKTGIPDDKIPSPTSFNPPQNNLGEVPASREIAQDDTPSSTSFNPPQNNLGEVPASCEITQQDDWTEFSPVCLEEQLLDHHCVPVDIAAQCPFNYLSPNESVGDLKTNNKLRPHLENMDPGIIVAVGTERCLFDILCTDPKKCHGLVVRDVNPRVKAYVDFVVLLLRISTTREDFCELARPPEPKNAAEKLQQIRKKLSTNTALPGVIQSHYLANLDNFSRIFYEEKHTGAKGDPLLSANCNLSAVNYYTNDKLFYTLRRYAMAGAIVSTIGPINDLSFLKKQRISVVDTSNVSEYSVLDIQSCASSPPFQLIWTSGQGPGTNYHSCRYSSLTVAERTELKDLHAQIQQVLGSNSENFALDLENTISLARLFLKDKDIAAPVASYTKEALEVVRAYCVGNLFEMPDCGFVSVDWMHIQKLNQVPMPIIEQVMNNPDFARLAPSLAMGYNRLQIPLYIKFMDLPGWKEVFEKIDASNFDQNDFFKCLQAQGLLQTFITKFGPERIATWSPSCKALLEAALHPPV